MTQEAATVTHRRSMLEAFDRAIDREAHHLIHDPRLIWQQLFNHLQWEPEPIPSVLSGRSTTGSPARGLWFRLRKRVPDVSLRTLIGHISSITACEVSPDSSYIVSASEDGMLKLWDPNTGMEIRSLMGHSDKVTDCAVAPDGSYIVSASEDETLRLWDPRTGLQIARLVLGSGLRACAVARDGSYIVSSGDRLSLWDPTSREQIAAFEEYASQCAVSPDGSFLMVAGGETTHLLDPVSGITLRIIEDSRLGPDDDEVEAGLGTPLYARGLAIAPDGSFVVSGHGEMNVTLWDTDSWAELRKLDGRLLKVAHGELPPQLSLQCWAIAPDGAYVAAGSEDSTLRIWDADSGNEIQILEGHGSAVRACAFAPNGSFIVSAAGRELKVWNPPFQRDSSIPSPHTEKVSACQVSPGGTYAVTAGYEELKFWDVTTGELTSTYETYPHRAVDCAISADGSYMISVGRETLSMWDPYTAQLLDPKKYRDWKTGGFLDPTVSREQFAEQIREQRSRGLRALVGEHHEFLAADRCAITPDGSQVITMGGDAIAMWEAATLKRWDPATKRFDTSSPAPQPLFTIDVPGTMTASAVAPDGSSVVTASLDGQLRIWSLRTGRLSKSWQTPGDWTFCLVSPDGEWIVSAGMDDALRLWNPATGEEIRTLEGEIAYVGRIAIAPDARLIAAGAGHFLHVWEVETGRELRKLPLLGAGSSAAFHPFAPVLVCGDTTGNVYFADLVGIRYGPVIVTMIERNHERIIRCPKCRQTHPLDEAWLRQVIDCPTPTCDLTLQVNHFIARGTRSRDLPGC